MSTIIIILLAIIIILMLFKWQKNKSIMRKNYTQHSSKGSNKNGTTEVEGYRKQRKDLELQYGKPTITLHFAINDFYSDVDVFEERQLIRLGKDFLPFNKVVGHNVLKETRIHYGQQFHHEGYNFAHYTDQPDSDIKDSYTVSVATGDLSNPTIFFYAGTEQKDVQMLLDILSIIEKSNKNA